MKVDVLNRVFKYGLFLLLGLFLTGCCDSDPIDKSAGVIDPPLANSKELLPFRMAFRHDGSPVFINEKGAVEAWERVEFPIKQVSEINYVQSFSVVAYTGSCVILVQTAGGFRKKEFPDWVCANLPK